MSKDQENPGSSEDISWYPPDISGCLRISQDVADRSKHDAAEISGYPRYISGYNNISQARWGYPGLDQNISEYSKVSQDSFRMSQDISGQIRIPWEYLWIDQDISRCFKIDQHIIPRMSKDQENPGCLRIFHDILRISQDVSGYLRMSQIDQNMMLRKSQDILGISQDITKYLRLD